jgi:hypothetical protein
MSLEIIKAHNREILVIFDDIARNNPSMSQFVCRLENEIANIKYPLKKNDLLEQVAREISVTMDISNIISKYVVFYGTEYATDLKLFDTMDNLASEIKQFRAKFNR